MCTLPAPDISMWLHFFSLLFLAKEIYGLISHAFWRDPFLPCRQQPLIEILHCLAQEAAHREKRQL